MEIMGIDLEFFKNKRVFITGHTGFKGTWLCKILEMAGAEVTGYALESPTEEGGKVFRLSGAEAGMNGSLSNFGVLKCLCTPGEDMH